MPKKHSNKILYTKPASSAPPTLSSSSGPAQHGASDSAAPSVNELVARLRQTQVSDDPAQALPRHTISATIHPALRSILDLPDIAPPIPRRGTMRTSGPSRTRRIPGPPPPASWLNASRHAPENTAIGQMAASSSRQVQLSSTLPGGSFPKEGTLQHTVLKAIATNWQWHLEYDHYHLATLATHLKETILSYIGIYWEPALDPSHGSRTHLPGLPANGLQALFPKDSAKEAIADWKDDAGNVTRLDLGGTIGRWITVRALTREIARPAVTAATDATPDSWDADANNSIPASLGAPMASRFTQLIHLSLAISSDIVSPHKVASWPGLLTLAPMISRISSLSLANWPVPSLTPNATATFVGIENPTSRSIPRVPYGGSNVYSAEDDDWREPAGILKRLSRDLYCLKWLDLTGCAAWAPALGAAGGPEWNGAWRDLEYLCLCIGWEPVIPDEAKPPAQEGGVAPPTNRTWLDPERDVGALWDWDVELTRRMYRYKKDVERYKDFRQGVEGVAEVLRGSRREHGGKWLVVERSSGDVVEV